MKTKENQLSAFGIQLWSLKQEMATDPKGTIEKLSSFGYRQIETFEGENGMSWGMKPREFIAFLNNLGLELIAAHCDILTDFDAKVEEAQALGLKYLVCPWLGPKNTLDEYKKAVDLFNLCGEKCFQAGLGFAYHNHDYSFSPIDGVVPQQLFLEKTNPEWVNFEMDIYWVEMAGENPMAWLSKYANRFPLVHFKDKANLVTDEKFISIELGKGCINYPSILQSCLQNGVKYFLVEQERFEGTTPLKAAKANAGYMRAL